MTYETVIYAVAQDVATVTLNRPAKMNCLSGLMRRELLHALRRAPDEARAVVLTGAGRGFCAGQDLGDAANLAELDLESTLRDDYEPLLRAIHDCPVPMICAVNGAAAGAGANLALAADVVIAARSAVFIEAFARIGLIPDAGGTYWLPRMVGLPRAMAMCLLAEPVPAERAAEWGLIWEAVPDAMLAARTDEIAQRLAHGPTLAFRRTKQALRASLSSTLDAQLALEAKFQGEAGRSRDFLEGVMAFADKRDPVFEGR